MRTQHRVGTGTCSRRCPRRCSLPASPPASRIPQAKFYVPLEGMALTSLCSSVPVCAVTESSDDCARISRASGHSHTGGGAGKGDGGGVQETGEEAGPLPRTRESRGVGGGIERLRHLN